MSESEVEGIFMSSSSVCVRD